MFKMCGAISATKKKHEKSIVFKKRDGNFNNKFICFENIIN